MKYEKSHLRKKFLSLRKKNYLKGKKFNFSFIFKLIKKHFKNRKIVISAYYPSNYEVNILSFLEAACNKKFKIALPVIKSSTLMSFKSWTFKQPLYISKFGILEPNKKNKDMIPDLILVPLVAFDDQLNRVGYGKGYYDRGLQKIKKIKKNALSVGIAHSSQQCKSIPINKYDFKLDYIFTERKIISSIK